MRFAKYHGIGNDFVMFADPSDELSLDAVTVARICDRRFGVGADGVIRVAPATNGADLFMDYVNSDGSLGEMCGNGIRCLAVFAKEEGLASGDQIKVDTRAGLRVVEILSDGRIRAEMGAPIFTPSEIPIETDGDNALDVEVDPGPDFVRFEVAALSMGNPHAVIFVDDASAVNVRSLGPAIETSAVFPSKTNVEFVEVHAPDRIEMRVWERGSGETLACGTGACAAMVATRLLRDGATRQVVSLPGGDLDVEWEGSLDVESPVFMTGPVAKSFEGDLDLDDYRGGSS
jgi:diaminopimelate epimerase